MPAVPVTITAVVYPKNKKDPPFPATIVGYAWITGLKPDNTPPIPPDPNAPHPSHPIMLPGDPGWGDPHPAHPIELPPVDVSPPETIPSDPKPPPSDGGWGWSPTYGWGYFPGSGGAQPKKK